MSKQYQIYSGSVFLFLKAVSCLSGNFVTCGRSALRPDAGWNSCYRISDVLTRSYQRCIWTSSYFLSVSNRTAHWETQDLDLYTKQIGAKHSDSDTVTTLSIHYYSVWEDPLCEALRPLADLSFSCRLNTWRCLFLPVDVSEEQALLQL